jgi:hypothetical protein
MLRVILNVIFMFFIFLFDTNVIFKITIKYDVSIVGWILNIIMISRIYLLYIWDAIWGVMRLRILIWYS